MATGGHFNIQRDYATCNCAMTSNYISQGSVATRFRRGRIFDANFPESVLIKVGQYLHKTLGGLFCDSQCIVSTTDAAAATLFSETSTTR